MSREEHDGTGAIVFEVAFNKRPQADYSYKTLRDYTLRIRQGGERLTPKVRRLNRPHNDRWEVTVAPGSKEDLTVSIGPFTTCSDAGAVCTAADEVLANRIDRTIEGPPGLSVADARVHENTGDPVAFAVTLGRASRETVTVDYATADGTGSNAATEGSDYTETSGTLTFAPGETEKTVSVPVLQDGHDEGEETFTADALQPLGRQRLAQGRDGGRHDREHRRDAAGVACPVRAHGGRAGARRGRGPVQDRAASGDRDAPRRPGDRWLSGARGRGGAPGGGRRGRSPLAPRGHDAMAAGRDPGKTAGTARGPGSGRAR